MSAHPGSNRPADFTGGHYDQPNVLVHSRVKDRVLNPDPSQKDALKMIDDAFPNEPAWPTPSKGRFIEEIQSDWHQKGKELGYLPPGAQEALAKAKKQYDDLSTQIRNMVPEIRKAAATDFQNKYNDTATSDVMDRAVRDHAELRALDNQRTAVLHEVQRLKHLTSGGVPDAPFKDAWPDLALKQQLLDVADSPEHEWIGFTGGKTQADRYDLSKQISKIHYTMPSNEAAGTLEAWDLNGNQVMSKAVEPKDLPDHIGKDAAHRLTSGDNAERLQAGIHAELKGENLQVGSEGMLHFYDNLLPSRMNKLLKPVGGKVERGELPGKITKADYGAEYNPEMGTHQIFDPNTIFDAPDEKFPGILDNAAVASVYPRTKDAMESLGVGNMPRQQAVESRVIELMQYLNSQNAKKEVNPIWMARLSPEIKKAIKEKGFPLMTLLSMMKAHESAQDKK